MKTFIKIGCFLILLFFIAPFILMFFRVAINGTGSSSSAADNPGKAIFDDLNRSITSYKEQHAHGNTEQAIELANSFSLLLKDIREEGFTKGKESTFSLSDGHFITYCYLDDKSLMFFCHVPQLRKFNDDAKASLTRIAWAIAQKAAEENKIEHKQLVVGLRGIALYYEFWFGNTKGAPTNKRSHSDGKNEIYKLLTPAKPQLPPNDSKPEQPAVESDESPKNNNEQNPDATTTPNAPSATDKQNDAPVIESTDADKTKSPTVEEPTTEAPQSAPEESAPSEEAK